MRRRLLTIAILLLAGAVVNVVVAWGCAVWIPLDDETMPTPLRVERPIASAVGWIADLRSRTGARRILWQRVLFRGGPITDLSSALPPPPLPPPPEKSPMPSWSLVDQSAHLRERSAYVIVEDARGWPRPAMWSVSVLNPGALPWWKFEPHGRSGIVIAGAQGVAITEALWSDVLWNSRVLPLRPVWPGFAINTLLYATFLWLLTCLAIAVRRFIRRRRGLCPECAYPMGESTVCTECGKELPRRVRPAT